MLLTLQLRSLCVLSLLTTATCNGWKITLTTSRTTKFFFFPTCFQASPTAIDYGMRTFRRALPDTSPESANADLSQPRSKPYSVTHLCAADMTVSRDIDQFWQELNRRPVNKGMSVVKAASETKLAALKPPISQPRPRSDRCDHHHLISPPIKHIQGTDCKDLEFDSLEQHMQRPLQMLKDPAATVRSRGLHSLRVHCCLF